MKELYKKNEITFSVVMIVIYVLGMSIMMNISKAAGLPNFFELMFAVSFTRLLVSFIGKEELRDKTGLCVPKVPAKNAAYYLPMYFVAVLPLFCGVKAQGGAKEMTLFVCKMLFVGFLEEIIFRGFLYKAIQKQNDKRAVVISALTFGVGHAVNLLNGSSVFETVIQILFAVGVGFMLVFIVRRTGSLIHCMLFHGLNNALTGFTSGSLLIKLMGSERNAVIIEVAVRLAITVGYTLWLIKCVEPLKAEKTAVPTKHGRR
ncbi:MAG: CPBP family intramembrane metalloprotease [Ruminococcus sp.]|uniref:CPBP family intramembrane glutamic endopeptidase n=1 Tax=Ruminococcus sp. TaxID=41978 RepID=UPI0025D32458|nr:type II CAAX endopeptidase family protein [Ruminococcus sp.]MBR0529478.1 CPBP family intramembrane metalloprotease [Ruminococcus sp.]